MNNIKYNINNIMYIILSLYHALFVSLRDEIIDPKAQLFLSPLIKADDCFPKTNLYTLVENIIL